MADEWFYAHRGVRQGPVSGERLQSLADAGQLDPDDLVWSEGMPSWTPGRDVPGLFPAPEWSPPPGLSGGSSSPVAAGLPPGGSFLGAVSYGQGGTSMGAPQALHPWQERPPEPARRSGAGAAIAAAAVIVTVGAYFVGNSLSLLGDGSKKTGPRQFGLRSGESREFFIEFPAAKEAHIWVTSKEDSDVDLFVYDRNNRLVVSDTRFDKDCHVSWHPDRTQTYKVVVANRVLVGGPVGNRNRSNNCTLKHFPE